MVQMLLFALVGFSSALVNLGIYNRDFCVDFSCLFSICSI